MMNVCEILLSVASADSILYLFDKKSHSMNWTTTVPLILSSLSVVWESAVNNQPFYSSAWTEEASCFSCVLFHVLVL